MSALLYGCSPAAGGNGQVDAPDDRVPIVIQDLTHEFIDFYDSTEALDMPARIQAFEEQVAIKFPEFYIQDGMNTRTRHAWYALGFSMFPELREEFEAKSASFAGEIEPIITRFANYFPDYEQSRPIMMVNSLGLFRARARSFKGREYMMFGVDGMAAFHDWDDQAPFIHHELFHLYHEDRFDNCQELWCFLWTEGLASLVSHELNPGADYQELMLDNPVGSLARVDKNLAVALSSLEDELEVKNSQLYGSLFLEGDAANAFPERYGYYLGYRIAREAALHHDIRDLAEIDATIAKPIVLKAYSTLLEKHRAQKNG